MADGQQTIIDRIKNRLKNRRDRLQKRLEQKPNRPRVQARRQIFLRFAEPAAGFRSKLAGLQQEHLAEVEKILKAAEEKSGDAGTGSGNRPKTEF